MLRTVVVPLTILHGRDRGHRPALCREQANGLPGIGLGRRMAMS